MTANTLKSTSESKDSREVELYSDNAGFVDHGPRVPTDNYGPITKAHEFWLSAEIHLDDIDIAKQQFSIIAWFNFFWRDDNDRLLAFVNDEQRAELTDMNQDFLEVDGLSYNAMQYLPVPNPDSFLLNCSNIVYTKKLVGKFRNRSNDEHIWTLYFAFRAVCNERFELSDFPFDGQFLNLKMTYNIRDYRMAPECPAWLFDSGRCDRYYLNRPLQIDVKDSIKSQWMVLSPWMDLRLRGDTQEMYKNDKTEIRSQTTLQLQQTCVYDPGTITDDREFVFRFSLIRMRVLRNPGFYLYVGVLPLFLLVCCAFAAFSISSETELGEKLSYVVTLLLTVSAFQYSLSTDLPKSSESTMIDTYILVAYLLLTIMIAEISIVAVLVDDEDLKATIDILVGAVCAIVWGWLTARFVIRFCKYKNGTSVNWNQLSMREMRTWHRGENDSKFKMVEKENFLL